MATITKRVKPSTEFVGAPTSLFIQSLLDQINQPNVKAKGPIVQRKMMVIADGIEYPSLNAALVGTGNKDWQVECPLRASAWSKIRKVIQRGERIEYQGHSFNMA
jgi:hypothetical protein